MSSRIAAAPPLASFLKYAFFSSGAAAILLLAEE